MHLRNRYFLLVISSKTIKNRLQFICKIGILTRACCSYFPCHDILSLDLVATLFFNNLAFSNHVLTVEKHSLKKGKYKPFKICIIVSSPWKQLINLQCLLHTKLTQSRFATSNSINLAVFRVQSSNNLFEMPIHLWYFRKQTIYLL